MKLSSERVSHDKRAHEATQYRLDERLSFICLDFAKVMYFIADRVIPLPPMRKKQEGREIV